MKTLGEQLAAARRELALRQRVYPRWLREGKIGDLKAAHETECMAGIVATLTRLVELAEISAELGGRKDAYDFGPNQNSGAGDCAADAGAGTGDEADSRFCRAAGSAVDVSAEPRPEAKESKIQAEMTL